MTNCLASVRGLCCACVALVSLGFTPAAFALTPYIQGHRLSCATLAACVRLSIQNLHAARFRIAGVHYPAGLPNDAIIVATDASLLNAIRNIGGSAIVAAGIRIHVKADGSVSYANPEYWCRAFFQKKFELADHVVQALHLRLEKVLGDAGGFGGEVSPLELANYRYMLGMEGFNSDKNALARYANFDIALRTVRANLARHVARTREVYAVIMRDRQIAVLGVALDDRKRGESTWVKQLGVENSAALPWEIYIVNGQVYALYGRYRTALAWPALDMARFMAISDQPEQIREQLTAVAGGKYKVSKAY